MNGAQPYKRKTKEQKYIQLVEYSSKIFVIYALNVYLCDYKTLHSFLAYHSLAFVGSKD